MPKDVHMTHIANQMQKKFDNRTISDNSNKSVEGDNPIVLQNAQLDDTAQTYTPLSHIISSYASINYDSSDVNNCDNSYDLNHEICIESASQAFRVEDGFSPVANRNSDISCQKWKEDEECTSTNFLNEPDSWDVSTYLYDEKKFRNNEKMPWCDELTINDRRGSNNSNVAVIDSATSDIYEENAVNDHISRSSKCSLAERSRVNSTESIGDDDSSSRSLARNKIKFIPNKTKTPHLCIGEYLGAGIIQNLSKTTGADYEILSLLLFAITGVRSKNRNAENLESKLIQLSKRLDNDSIIKNELLSLARLVNDDRMFATRAKYVLELIDSTRVFKRKSFIPFIEQIRESIQRYNVRVAYASDNVNSRPKQTLDTMEADSSCCHNLSDLTNDMNIASICVSVAAQARRFILIVDWILSQQFIVDIAETTKLRILIIERNVILNEIEMLLTDRCSEELMKKRCIYILCAVEKSCAALKKIIYSNQNISLPFVNQCPNRKKVASLSCVTSSKEKIHNAISSNPNSALANTRSSSLSAPVYSLLTDPRCTKSAAELLSAPQILSPAADLSVTESKIRSENKCFQNIKKLMIREKCSIGTDSTPRHKLGDIKLEIQRSSITATINQSPPNSGSIESPNPKLFLPPQNIYQSPNTANSSNSIKNKIPIIEIPVAKCLNPLACDIPNYHSNSESSGSRATSTEVPSSDRIITYSESPGRKKKLYDNVSICSPDVYRVSPEDTSNNKYAHIESVLSTLSFKNKKGAFSCTNVQNPDIKSAVNTSLISELKRNKTYCRRNSWVEELMKVQSSRQISKGKAKAEYQDSIIGGYDYNEGAIEFTKSGQISCGTLSALVERLTLHDQVLDRQFTSAFLLTFRQFTNPSIFLKMLIQRFNLNPPSNLNQDQYDIWKEKKQFPIRLRTFNVIRLWIESFWFPSTDDECLDELREFALKEMPQLCNKLSKRLISLLDKRIEGASPVTGNTNIVPLSECPIPIIPKHKITSINDLDATEVARQLTLIVSKLFMLIKSQDLIERSWDKKDDNSDNPTSTIKSIIMLSNRITFWTVSIILNERDVNKRANKLKFFIKLCTKLISINNYDSLMAIKSAIEMSCVARLHKTWEVLPNKTKVAYERIATLFDVGKNFSNYRSVIKNMACPCIPFLGLYLTDLTFIHNGMPTFRDDNGQKNMINFSKFTEIYKAIHHLTSFKMIYSFQEVPQIQNFLLNEFESTDNIPSSKLYELSLLVEPREVGNTEAQASVDAKVKALQKAGLLKM